MSPTKSSLLLLLMIALCGLSSISTAQASTVTFSDPLSTGQQILVYQVEANGSTMITETNTTGSVILPDGHDYVFLVKPSGAGVIQNPGTTLDWLGSGILVMFAVGLIFGIVIAFLVILLKQFRVI